jgi:hypothetical protein
MLLVCGAAQLGAVPVDNVDGVLVGVIEAGNVARRRSAR